MLQARVVILAIFASVPVARAAEPTPPTPSAAPIAPDFAVPATWTAAIRQTGSDMRSLAAAARNYLAKQDNEQLVTLLANDPDPAIRFYAAQRLGTSGYKPCIDALLNAILDPGAGEWCDFWTAPDGTLCTGRGFHPISVAAERALAALTNIPFPTDSVSHMWRDRRKAYLYWHNQLHPSTQPR